MRRIILCLFLLSGCGETNNQYFKQKEPQYMVTTEAMIGLTERKDYKELKKFLGVDPRYVEWCAAYVNAVLEMHGYPTTDSLMARSFLDYGEKAILPEFGDIVVLRRGESWQGHVGFFVRKEIKDNQVYYVVLGGNQSNSINLQSFKASKVLSVRKLRFSEE